MPTFEETAAGYRNMWNLAKVRPEIVSQCERVCRGILADKARYQAVSAKTGVPWFWIAAVHNRESGRDWKTSLGQGDPWDKVSVHVPKGRGPFSSWEAAAIDSLVTLKHLDQIKDWSISRMLYEFERYNGFGYTGKINSPYVWAGTTLQQRGKYVADGHYDPTAWDAQLGCAAILRTLCVIDGTVADHIGASNVPPPPDVPKSEPRKLNWFELLLKAILRR